MPEQRVRRVPGEGRKDLLGISWYAVHERDVGLSLKSVDKRVSRSDAKQQERVLTLNVELSELAIGEPVPLQGPRLFSSVSYCTAGQHSPSPPRSA